ncbi:ferritin-like domain-containing protein [Actinomadura fibrosa]|uniref:Ferritin-like domain-containing protein n=1 Tax=Actinomadura fibrosa TaxID=111802 RepID=A0ABW2XJL8_9ACTN|nr:ferritin-like domain-containing protein [Actinomadura fibrosa]
MPEAVPCPPRVSRRALLGGAAALALPWPAGCTAEAVPREDVSTLVEAISSEQDLVATYEAARSADASLARRIDPVLAHHREHLAVLKRHYLPGSGDRAHEGGAIPSPKAIALPGGATAIMAALRAEEQRAAAARSEDTGKAGPGLSQLLASIGACEAGHAGTVRDPAPSAMPKFDLQALQTALAAEHAAVYGYGLLGARLRGPLQQTAKAVWEAHRTQRDRLVALLSAEPVAAAAAYRLPVRVTSARSAVQLAAALEDALVPAYVGLAGASHPQLRRFAAGCAQNAMARSAGWRQKGGAAAPREAFPGLPPAALSPRPEPGE